MLLLLSFTTIVLCKSIKYLSKEENGNLVSFGHSFFQFTCALLFFIYNPHFFQVSCWSMIHTQIDTTSQLTILLSYTLYDTFENNNKFDMLIHHIIVIICSIIGLNLKSHQLVGMFILLNESSTPFLNLIKMNACKPASEILFLMTFCVFRIFLLPWLLVILWPCVDNKTTFIIFTIICGLLCLNMYWARLICLQCIKRYKTLYNV